MNAIRNQTRNITRSLIAGLMVATAAGSVLAAGAGGNDEGLPSALAQSWHQAPVIAEGSATRYASPYLLTPGGEITLVRNPAYVAPAVARTPAQVIRTQSAPATSYVGA